MAGPIQSVPALLDALKQHQLLNGSQLDELARNRSGDARTLARTILDRNLLTPYQVNLLLQGRGRELVLGSYLLLERIGEGATGQVFKAQHVHMRRTVAVKLLRKEAHIDEETLERFRREMQLASQVTHPNVVQAYDAGLADGAYFLVMEFIDGKDLGDLVARQGPLTFAQASSYIRQAALGLQHIHERGLVHRDIKPSNLLVAGQAASDFGTLKILDLGLARLQHAVQRDTAKLTSTGALVMGTVDFMAPEQALDFRQVDIRADIYSLGCTFYFILTGKVPFTGLTVAEKLLRHQQAEPEPIERLRRDLPAPLRAVVHKMMAKRPEDRYQQPGELAPHLGTMLPAVAALPMAIPLNAPAAAHTNVIDAEFTVRTQRPLWLTTVQRARRAWCFAFASRRRALLSLGLLAVFAIAAFLMKPAGLIEPGGPVYLSDLKELKLITEDPDCFSKNGVFGSDQRIMVKNSPAPKGLYARPPGANKSVRVQYDIDRKFKRLQGGAAIDDSIDHCVPCAFIVIGDGKELWKSAPIERPRQPQFFDVDVADVKVLEMMTAPARSGGEGFERPVRAVWIDPVLVR